MMISRNCNLTLEAILDVFTSRYQIQSSDKGCLLVTPFRYPDNSPITVEVIQLAENTFQVTDNGEASDYAYASGVGEGSIRDRLKKVERRYGVSTVGQEISMETTKEGIGDALLALVGGIQDTGYLIYKQSRRGSPKTLSADVERYLVSNMWPYEKNVQVQGLSSPRRVDYQVSGEGPRQLLLFTYEPSKSSGADQRLDAILVTSTELIQTNQVNELRGLAVIVNALNGEGGERSQRAVDAIARMRKWNIPNVIPWSQHHELKRLLAA